MALDLAMAARRTNDKRDALPPWGRGNGRRHLLPKLTRIGHNGQVDGFKSQLSERMRSPTHQLRRIQIRTRNRGKRSQHQSVFVQGKGTIELPAPRIFSLVENPLETVHYLARVHRQLQTHHVRAKLQDVAHLTPDALLALITYADASPSGTRLSGDLPSSAVARQVAETCGFPALVQGLSVPHRDRTGIVETETTSARRGNDAAEQLAYELVTRACSMSGIPYHRISYSNLIECMTNTNNHAGREQGSIAWRVMVTSADRNGPMRFIFMDAGLGICRTVKLRTPKILNDAELLKTIFGQSSGGIRTLFAGSPTKTRTARPGRGRGLRKIAQSLERGNLRRLVILANGGYLDLGARRSEYLLHRFRGTLVYWEVEPPALGV